MECKFLVGDAVMLNGNPHDEQYGKFGAYGIHVVTAVKKAPNDWWIKTNKEKSWISHTWFDSLPLNAAPG
jgi:hypothetical protein